MNKSYKILKVRDKNDSYYTPIDNLFDLPMRLLINGKSQLSGKTTIILNLLLSTEFPYFGKFDGDNIYIVSNNKLDNKLDIMATKLLVPEQNRMMFDEDHLEILYDDWEESFKEETMDGGKPANRLIIFDDCGYSGSLKNYKKENIIDKLICNGRHMNLSQIYTSQRFSQCSTTLRTNLTGAILFNTSAKELDLITDDMNYMAKSNDFIKMFRRETKEPRSFLVVNFSNPPEALYMNQFFQPISWT
tara:strand:+ start:388 stop:1125 length:738 start_codon:yes stop_codon:yes gene_type:complete